MSVSLETYRTLFTSVFQLSACTFGGGYVIVPLMRRKFVEKLHWIGEQEMMDLTAIAQSCPGPIAVNASILIGYRVAKVPGALLAVLGTVLPPLIIITVISYFYAAFRDNLLFSMLMAGMLAGVAAVVCDVVITLCAGIFKQKRLLPVVILAASFLAVSFFHVNIIVIIVLCACVGAADTLVQSKRKGGAAK